MIPGVTILSFVIAAAFCLILPVVIIIVLLVKGKASGLPLILGAGAFFISQIVLRIPVLNILSRYEWYETLTDNFILIVLFLSLSAGLFEETARLGGALALKKKRSYKDIISFGIGHAFCEVILLTGFTHINNIIYSISVNNDSGVLTALIPEQTLETISAQLIAVNPLHVYLGVVERFSAVLFHIFAAMLIFKCVKLKKRHYYFLAVGAHTVFNITGAVLVKYSGVIITEAALLIMALAAGWYVIKQRDKEGAVSPNAEPAIQ